MLCKPAVQQYFLFYIFIGGAQPDSGDYHRDSKP